MPRASLALVALLTIGCISVLGYSCATRTGTASSESAGKSLIEGAADASPPAAATPASQHSAAATEQTQSQVQDDARTSQTTPPDTVAKWIADATGGDAKARAAAIAALATAPRSQAVPVLQRVLKAGELVDRPLALRSLRALALNQGDADGGIRNALRDVIYDGGDEAVSQDAQTALDEIEGDPGLTEPHANP